MGHRHALTNRKCGTEQYRDSLLFLITTTGDLLKDIAGKCDLSAFKLDFLGTKNPGELTINAGYQFLSDDNGGFGSTVGGEGAYIGFNLGFSF